MGVRRDALRDIGQQLNSASKQRKALAAILYAGACIEFYRAWKTVRRMNDAAR